MPTISLDTLNLNQKCEKPVALEVLGLDGKPIGVTMQVLGAHSKVVQDFINREINASRTKQAMDAKFSRKKVNVTPIEDDIAFGIESVAIRIASWDGISEDCTPENAVKLCTINSDICRQVREFSEDLANFTKG